MELTHQNDEVVTMSCNNRRKDKCSSKRCTKNRGSDFEKFTIQVVLALLFFFSFSFSFSQLLYIYNG